jgi:hypothetical protein
MIRVEMRAGEEEVGKRKKRMVAKRVCLVETEDRESAVSEFVQYFAADLKHDPAGLTAMLDKHDNFRLGKQQFRVFNPSEEDF